MLKVNCQNCHIEFEKKPYEVKRTKNNLCSQKCFKEFETKIKGVPPLKVICLQCKKEFYKRQFEIKNHPNHFCSHSCNATYQNTHKTKGTRISKLELYLQKELTILYPNLEFHFNRKDAINSELDIYIPSLKLAFELNGIFHYEPIYGQDKLTQIQNNDNRKFQACLEKQIELCIIDTSSLKYFKHKNCEKYLDIINKIISNKEEGNLIEKSPN